MWGLKRISRAVSLFNLPDLSGDLVQIQEDRDQR